MLHRGSHQRCHGQLPLSPKVISLPLADGAYHLGDLPHCETLDYRIICGGLASGHSKTNDLSVPRAGPLRLETGHRCRMQIQFPRVWCWHLLLYHHLKRNRFGSTRRNLQKWGERLSRSGKIRGKHSEVIQYR